jgi:hypothetical protein
MLRGTRTFSGYELPPSRAMHRRLGWPGWPVSYALLFGMRITLPVTGGLIPGLERRGALKSIAYEAKINETHGT